MKAYKLTDENNQTKLSTKWGPNVTHTARGTSSVLCTDGWIHFYMDPVLAVLVNPIHANYVWPNLWECETSGEHLHEPLKSGCRTLTTVNQILLPAITVIQKTTFAILCAKEETNNYNSWKAWADKWLSGEDRSRTSADCAQQISRTTLGSFAALSAKYASDVAASSNDAWYAAKYAAYVARSIEQAEYKVDFVAIANKALTYT